MARVEPVDVLADIRKRYEEDPAFASLRHPGIRFVPGFGAYQPKVLLVGEAPGATENEHGRPFCGAAGRVLEQILPQIGVSWFWTGKQTRARVIPGCAEGIEPNAYVTNVVKYRPPGNRQPFPREVIESLPYLREEWSALGGYSIGAVVALGGTAKLALKPELPSLSSCAAEVYRFGSSWLVPMFHPSFALRTPSFRDTYMEHWERVGEWLREEGIL